MDNLQLHLEQLQATLSSLQQVLQGEQDLLCAGLVDGIALQRLTEQKSTLLSTVRHLEQQRRVLEEQLALQAPYATSPALAQCWLQIRQHGQALSQLNQHNGLLLAEHQRLNSTQLAQLQRSQGQALYGPDGQSMTRGARGRKIGI